jgi:hypothetical protein
MHLIRFILGLMLLFLLFACNGEQAPPPAQDPPPLPSAWHATADGIFVDLERPDFQKLRLQVIDDRIVCVTASPGGDFSPLSS